MVKGKKANGIFTALGAATGLGNVLRFPSLCASYGGAFIFAYVLSLALVCFPLLCAELQLGKTFDDPLDIALKSCAPKLSWLAYSAAVNSAVVALYYGVICAKLGGAFFTFTISGEAGDTNGFTLFVIGALSLFAVWFILRGKRSYLSRTGAVSVAGSLSLFALLAVTVLVKGGSIAAVFRFQACDLASGGMWADALGQSLLALSLAGAVMPTFARSFGKDFSVAHAAAKIIAANLAGCILSAVAVLALSVPVPEGGGVTVALTLYPKVIASAFSHTVLRRIFGAMFFAVLWLVALQSSCSLFSPVIGLAGENRRLLAVSALCLFSLILLPLFAARSCIAMNALDRMACTVNAVIIAFLECFIFVTPRNMRRLTRDFGKFLQILLKWFCPATCGALVLFSLCGARFSCFPAYAVFIAAVALTTVFVPVFPSVLKAAKKVGERIYDIKSHNVL